VFTLVPNYWPSAVARRRTKLKLRGEKYEQALDSIWKRRNSYDYDS
jgi:hypothetical protein